MAKRKKGFTGNAPKNGKLLHQLSDWDLYSILPQQSDWQRLKLVLKKGKARKANYWLAWNGERFAEGKEYFALRLHQPALYIEMLSVLSK